MSLPTHCPFCTSAAISASGQKVTSSTYWRCETCLQIWHPERLQPSGARSSSVQPFYDWARPERARS